MGLIFCNEISWGSYGKSYYRKPKLYLWSTFISLNWCIHWSLCLKPPISAECDVWCWTGLQKTEKLICHLNTFLKTYRTVTVQTFLCFCHQQAFKNYNKHIYSVCKVQVKVSDFGTGLIGSLLMSHVHGHDALSIQNKIIMDIIFSTKDSLQ